MTLATLAPAVQRATLAYAAEVRATPHRGTFVAYDDQDGSHLYGEYGNGDRAGYGYTKAEVVALRSLLKLRINLATAEGLLMEALSWVDAKQTVSMTQYAAKKQRRRRNRRDGYCLECCTRPARSGLKTCQPCSDARVARRRRALGKTA